MNRSLARLAIGAAFVASSAALADDAARPYAREPRVAHIRAALTAMAAAPPETLRKAYEHARGVERGACSAGSVRLRVECLLVASKKYCSETATASHDCALYMDVIVSNVLADEFLIPREKRYQIVRTNADYRPALARELRRIQGTMAVDFRLHGKGTGGDDDAETMASNIDRYCRGAADESNVPYQICVSSLAFFIKGPS